MSTKATWRLYVETGKLSDEEKQELPDSVFAFPKERKEPLTDATHAKNALARFDQVEGVTDQERDRAWANILVAAAYFGVDVREKDWRALGHKPRA